MTKARAVARTSARQLIIISGAGIAGLTAALTLERKGFRVCVLEKQDGPTQAGAGIQISPNAYKILHRLGLTRELFEASGFPSSILIRSGISGELLSEFQLGEAVRKRHEAPYLVLHRSDLLRILLNACEKVRDIDIRYGHRVSDAATHANGVTIQVQLPDRVKEFHAVALIGADGVWSALRRIVKSASEPKFSGQIAWRGLLPMDAVSTDLSRKSTGLWLGPNAHLVHYPIRGGSLLNVVAITPWQGENPPLREWLFEAPGKQRLEPFEDWADVVRDLLRVNAPWGGWPVYSVEQARQCCTGNICLIGDAAHAMLPFAAQGGASAIEDAASLAKFCARHDSNMATAFQEFWQHRRKRLNRVVAISAKNQRIYHMASRSAAVRDLVLKNTPQRLLQRRMDWLYSWEA